MVERALYYLTFASAIGSGLTAGVFFAFSSFVMAALARIAPQSGIDAMNAINVTVINPGFMLAFMGTGLLCLMLLAGAYVWWGGLDAWLILAASLLYLLGCIGVTMTLNVPLNDALAAVQLGTPGADAFWQTYLRDWTFWNTVRTLASLISAIMFIVILIRRAGL
jgi:uncharacterized membrane protein